MQSLLSNEVRMIADWLAGNVMFTKRLLTEMKQEQSLNPERAARVFVGLRGCVFMDSSSVRKTRPTKRFAVELQAGRFMVLHWRQSARQFNDANPYSDDPPADTIHIFTTEVMLTYKNEAIDPVILRWAAQDLMNKTYSYAFTKAFPERVVIHDYTAIDKQLNPVVRCTWDTEVELPPIEED